MPATSWPALKHVHSNKLIPLRVDGVTTFGRAEQFHDYNALGSKRWSAELKETLETCDYVMISANTFMSRTHGKILHVADSDTLIYQDLNSTNGTVLNGAPMMRTEGTMRLAKSLRQNEDLPTAMVGDGDVLKLGRDEFKVVMIRNVTAEVAARRAALLVDGTGRDRRESFKITLNLLATKGFIKERVGLVDANAESIKDTYGRSRRALMSDLANSTGFSVIYLKAPVVDGVLKIGDYPAETPQSLLQWLDWTPGSKVVVLQSDGDLSAFEEAFEKEAYQDSLLIRYQGLEEPELDEIGLNSLCESFKKDRVSGTFRIGNQDTPDDILNALIPPDRPNLRVDALEPYTKKDLDRIKLIIGTNLREDDSYGGVLHSLSFAAGSSLRHSMQSSGPGA